jgi:cysteine desulfurase
MAPFWSETFGNPHSAEHGFGWRANEAVERAAASIARLIGAEADEIIFTAGATEANNLAILGLAHRAPAARRRILISAVEHKSALSAAQAAANRYGMTLETMPVDGEGRIDVSRLAKTIAQDVLCVVAMAVNNEIGTVQDTPTLAAISAEAGAHLVCDAVQAPLAIDLDVDRDNIPLLILSAHKIYGPKGIGALYVRRDLLNSIEPQIYGGQQQGGLRAGTVPTPLCVGFGAAAALLEKREAARERTTVASLRHRFEESLRRFGHPVAFNGSAAARHPGNSNARFPGQDGRDLIASLQPRLADSSVRFSFGRFTTELDATAALEALSEALTAEEAA